MLGHAIRLLLELVTRWADPQLRLDSVVSAFMQHHRDRRHMAFGD
jgi:hypothetical protein